MKFRDKNDQVIFCEVAVKKTFTKTFSSFVYSLNTVNERKLLWKKLKNQESLVRDLPWVVLGDFNAIKKNEEKEKGLLLLILIGNN